jgi:pyruvate,water dikinase
MIDGQRSFVLFSCDPRTGGRDPVIAAGFGIGEGVVQERVAVDHYFCTRATARITAEVASKPTMLGPDPARAAGGLVERAVPAAARDRRCLTDDEVRAIVALGDRIEELFGCAQDIEGTITADGAIYTVQARPIALDRRQRRLWSNANITESFPGVTTALTYSLARWFYDADFFDLYRRLGVGYGDLRANAPALPGMIGFVRGRIYYSLSEWYRLYRLHDLFPAYRRDWERMMGLPGPADDQGDHLLRRGESPLRAAARLARPVATVVRLVGNHDRAMRDFEAWWTGVIIPARARSADGRNIMELAADFHEVWQQVVTRWGVTLVNDLLITTTHGAVSSLLGRWLPDEGDDLLPGLLCGGQESRSMSAVMSAIALAEHVRSDASALAALSSPPRDAWRDIERGRYGAHLRQLFRSHLRLYGDRGLQELKMEQPNTRDAPWLLLDLVVSYSRTDVTAAALRARERNARARAERRLAAGLGSRSARRLTVRFLAERLRRYLRYRENSRYCRSELFGFAKRIFRQMGHELTTAGMLDAPEDVVHLTVEELLGYADGTGTVGNLRALADIRRAEFRAPGPELPMNFATLGPVREHLPAERARIISDARELAGLGSSPGRVRGTARVVIEPTGKVDLPQDAILVARETDPGWLFLMLKARAIVVERGTLLSHTAITGRLFGIPTVVAVADATTRIPDGALIEVEGTTGHVRILPPGE